MRKKENKIEITKQQRQLIVFIRTHLYNRMEVLIKVHEGQPSAWFIPYPFYRWGYGIPEVTGHKLTPRELWLIDELKACKYGELRVLCNRGQPAELVHEGCWRRYKPEDVEKGTIHDQEI